MLARKTSILQSLVLCALLLVAAAVPPPVPAAADPSAGDLAAQATQVRSQLNASRTEMAKNLAEYNRLTADLATTHADVSRLTDQLYDLRQSLKKQQGKLSELAARRYETGGLGFLDVLVGARTWRQLAIGMDYVDSVAQQTAEVVDDVKTTRAQTERVRTARKERESRITSLRRDVKAQRLKIVKEIAQQQASLDSLDSRIVQMVNEQERAAQSGGRGTLDVPVGGNAWMNASSLLPGASAKVDGSGSYLIPGAQPTRYQTIGLGFDWTSSTYGNADNTPPNSTATASSRPFHETELTCANKILPFGTLLAVSNAGRRVIVVVSDRGPYIPGRALDLSTAAANAVGLPGVGGVHVEIVLPE